MLKLKKYFRRQKVKVLSSPLVSLFRSRGNSVCRLNGALDQWGMGVGFVAEAEWFFSIRYRPALRPSIDYMFNGLMFNL